jgi:hypothetical protein
MKYIILAITVTIFLGCGSNGSSGKKDDKIVKASTPPKSPQAKETKNIPPSIPKI